MYVVWSNDTINDRYCHFSTRTIEDAVDKFRELKENYKLGPKFNLSLYDISELSIKCSILDQDIDFRLSRLPYGPKKKLYILEIHESGKLNNIPYDFLNIKFGSSPDDLIGIAIEYFITEWSTKCSNRCEQMQSLHFLLGTRKKYTIKLKDDLCTIQIYKI